MDAPVRRLAPPSAKRPGTAVQTCMMRRSCSNTEKRHQIIWCRFVIGLHIDRIAVSGNSLKRTLRRPVRFSFDIRDPA